MPVPVRGEFQGGGGAKERPISLEDNSYGVTFGSPKGHEIEQR